MADGALTPAVLNDGLPMPWLGFGTFPVPDAEVGDLVHAALGAGYRRLDTAAGYGNEAGIGAALDRADVPRADVFVTTKLNGPDHGYERTLAACRESLRRLRTERLDLYLIHWPRPTVDLYVESWRALVRLRADGLVRSIGVSNFQPEHLRRIVDETGETPAVNQIELHPYHQQPVLRALHADLGVLTEAWSPLGNGNPVLGDPVVARIAATRGCTPAQVVLRWHLDLGHAIAPKSSSPQRLRENLAAAGVVLTDADRADLAALDRSTPTSSLDPFTYTG